MRYLLTAALAIGLVGCSSSTEMTTDTPETPSTPVESPATPPVSDDDITPCEDGTAGDYDCSRVDLVSRVSIEDFNAERGNDIWGWTDPETGVEYALVGLDNGTSFVSLEDPTNPLNLGKVPTATVATVWRDIKVYRDHAFIVSEAENHGMQVFDLTRLRGLDADPDRTFEPDVMYRGVTNAHNIVADEESGFMYIVGMTSVGDDLPASCAAPGFHALDVRDPKNPTFSTCFSDADADNRPRSAPGYTHDAQCLVYRGPDADYNGRQLCFAANEDVLTVFDVEDKQNVTMISQAEYPGASYSHQGWLTEDQRFFLLNDELDEISGVTSTQRTLVFDLEDLDNPEFAYVWDSGMTVIDHNLYNIGDYSYQSNYKAGLRILDISNIADGPDGIEEVAYFDTFPQGEDVQFGGQWSNYPYFESGLVIANDSQNGLFVLRPRLDEPEM
ncbi:MAG: choice-of-anchor B family protein [Bacteroidota bacterium]